MAENMIKNKISILVLTIIFVMSGNVFAQRNSLAANSQTATLQTLNGENISLDSHKGKVVVLAIGASWLPLSKQQATTTNKLIKKYANNNVVIYWVSTDSTNAKSKNYASNEQIQMFATRNKLTATILRDSDGAFTLKRFAVDQLPSFVVLDKTGKAIGEPFGGLDPENETEIFNQVAGAIDKIL